RKKKKETPNHNRKNRLNLRQETFDQINSRREQIADVTRRRSQIELALAQSERALQSARYNLQNLEERLQTERLDHREISRKLVEIEESIRELRPLGEACQEEKNRIQVSLAEKKLRCQHLVDNIRDRYDADLESLRFVTSDSTVSTGDLLAEIDDLRARLERMGEVNLAAIGEYEALS